MPPHAIVYDPQHNVEDEGTGNLRNNNSLVLIDYLGCGSIGRKTHLYYYAFVFFIFEN